MSAAHEDRALRWLKAADVLTEHAADATAGPWECTDCEGDLAVNAATALPTRYPNGGYRDAGRYEPQHKVLVRDLDTWDEGQDDQDDEARGNARWVALADPRLAQPLAALLRNVAYYSDELAGSWHEHADEVAAVVLDDDRAVQPT